MCSSELSNCLSIYFYWLGLGLGDILKPELVMPLIETLPLEQLLASYLPEVGSIVLFEISLFSILHLVMILSRLQGQWSAEDILELLQSPPFRQQVDSFTYVRIWSLICSRFFIFNFSFFCNMLFYF